MNTAILKRADLLRVVRGSVLPTYVEFCSTLLTLSHPASLPQTLGGTPHPAPAQPLATLICFLSVDLSVLDISYKENPTGCAGFFCISRWWLLFTGCLLITSNAAGSSQSSQQPHFSDNDTEMQELFLRSTNPSNFFPVSALSLLKLLWPASPACWLAVHLEKKQAGLDHSS